MWLVYYNAIYPTDLKTDISLFFLIIRAIHTLLRFYFVLLQAKQTEYVIIAENVVDYRRKFPLDLDQRNYSPFETQSFPVKLSFNLKIRNLRKFRICRKAQNRCENAVSTTLLNWIEAFNVPDWWNYSASVTRFARMN